jgi:hypothetical protein
LRRQPRAANCKPGQADICKKHQEHIVEMLKHVAELRTGQKAITESVSEIKSDVRLMRADIAKIGRGG